jgi:hypothetical protein
MGHKAASIMLIELQVSHLSLFRKSTNYTLGVFALTLKKV